MVLTFLYSWGGQLPSGNLEGSSQSLERRKEKILTLWFELGFSSCLRLAEIKDLPGRGSRKNYGLGSVCVEGGVLLCVLGFK